MSVALSPLALMRAGIANADPVTLRLATNAMSRTTVSKLDCTDCGIDLDRLEVDVVLEEYGVFAGRCFMCEQVLRHRCPVNEYGKGRHRHGCVHLV